MPAQQVMRHVAPPRSRSLFGGGGGGHDAGGMDEQRRFEPQQPATIEPAEGMRSATEHALLTARAEFKAIVAALAAAPRR